jgi:chromosome segregation ATPase
VQVEQASLQQAQVEEARRKENVEDMTSKLGSISERLNEQQSVMSTQHSENECLRKQLQSMGDVVRLSEKMKEEYDKELTSLRDGLTQQVCASDR